MKTISLETIKSFGPCAEDYATVCRLYPRGVPLALEAYDALVAAKVDVWWVLPNLLDNAGRGEFVLHTLRYRQPRLVSLFRKAGLPEHADAIEACRFDTPKQAWEAKTILTAAWKAARETTWDAARATASAAARYAAWATASAAAWDAAWSSARAAANATAWSAAWTARAAWDTWDARDAANDAAWRDMAAWIIARLEAAR